MGEMNNRVERTASSLTITEKKPHRPGGCVGVFFQLFDWNRRFAKKKLFSKKFLPPARSKQSSKKFGGDERQPKLRLIADENTGGFPNMKKSCNGATSVDPEERHEMRPPSLVARLMGLESMPAVSREKSKRASLPESGKERQEKFVDDHVKFDRGEANGERMASKQELRPQKLQKTGLSERQPSTRFGAEAMQFKSVLSRAKKHHPKLTSPVRSPKHLPGRNTSRLIGAATRILEPGLQRGRSKCALTYSRTLRNKPETILSEPKEFLPGQLENSHRFTLDVVEPMEQVCCRNCGRLVNDMDPKPSFDVQTSDFASSFSHSIQLSCQGSQRNKQIEPKLCPLCDKKRVQVDSRVNEASAMDKLHPHGKFASDKRSFAVGHQMQCHSCSLQKDMPRPFCYSCNAQIQSQMSRAVDRIAPRSRLNSLHIAKTSGNDVINETAINKTKNFVSLNRNLSSHTRSQIPTRTDSGKFGTERRFNNRHNNCTPPVRKRPPNASRQIETSIVLDSKQTNHGLNSPSRKEMRCNFQSDSKYCSGSRSIHQQESRRMVANGKEDTNVKAFGYNSRLRQKNVIDKNDKRTESEKSFPLKGDALGALLEQKLKELASQEDEMGMGSNTTKRTTVTILQELISALTSDRSFQTENANIIYDGKSCSYSSFSGPNSEVEPRATNASVKLPHNSELLSPGSVLQASFSNESCLSSNREESSGYKLRAGSMDCSCDASCSLDPSAECTDSATSVSTTRSSRESVVNMLKFCSEILCCSNLANTGIKGSKFDHAKKVLLNAELVFRNAGFPPSSGKKDFLIKHLVVDELDTLANVLSINFGCFLGVEDGKEANRLRGLAFDCIVEYLESRFSRFPKSGFKVSSKLPFQLNVEMLIYEIVNEARRWSELSELIRDDLIEWEMSHSLGKWMDFEMEACESAVEISHHILQALIDEIVADFWLNAC